jgi:alanyl-tRNA synthetase
MGVFPEIKKTTNFATNGWEEAAFRPLESEDLAADRNYRLKEKRLMEPKHLNCNDTFGFPIDLTALMAEKNSLVKLVFDKRREPQKSLLVLHQKFPQMI